MLYIGADHRGYKLKEELKDYLKREKIPFVDMGAKKLDPSDDYPKFAAAVAKAVSNKPNANKGILLCRSGQGVCIAANKFKGVRAALSWNEAIAKASRNDDDANVLCLAADYVSTEMAEDIVHVFLNTSFSGAERHLRRINEVSRLK